MKQGDKGKEVATAETQAATAETEAATSNALAATAADSDRPSTGSSLAPTEVDLSQTPLEERGFEARYEVKRELGHGGMGEVKLCRDERIGRYVAMKLLRDPGASSDLLARFVREGRVQGQLEHPAIVPVYDMGLRPDGAPYFTMKRLRGLTLEQIVDAHRRNDVDITARLSLRKLLTEFSKVCQAIHFAHSRGVLHRDLKPANIMLGDFGEVYVLDWGVAKIAGLADASGNPGTNATSIDTNDRIDTRETAAGSVMGTPGYMAPEQMRGEVDDLDARSDVYALGAMLFELLTLEPLHARTSASGIVQSTLDGADARACHRAPERHIAPELEAICIKATALEQADRYESAGDLVAELDRYLDGDRDIARRRELAGAHASAASLAARDALENDDTDARKRALGDAGRALALDPENATAAGVLSRLMLEPPEETPEEVETSLRESLDEQSRKEAQMGFWIFLAFLLFAPVLLLMGVKNWSLFFALGFAAVAQAFLCLYAARKPVFRSWPIYVALVMQTIFFIAMSRMFGPFVFIPAAASIGTIGLLYHRHRIRVWIIIVMGMAVIVVPTVLEWTGVLASTYQFRDGVWIVDSHFIDMPEKVTVAVLLVMSVSVVFAAAMFINRLRIQQTDSERRLHMQAWQLKQLMPDDVAAPASDT